VQALTIKEECVDSLLDICLELRPLGFLEFNKDFSAMYSTDGSLIFIEDEESFI